MLNIVSNQLCQRLLSFAKDTRGGATIESVISLPLLMFWYVASFTFFDAYRVINLNEKATFTVLDLLSRQSKDTNITSVQLEGLNKIYDFLVKDTGPTRIRVTSVGFQTPPAGDTSKSGYQLLWSFGTRGAPVRTQAELDDVLMKTRLPTIPELGSVILLETSLQYTPPFNVGIGQQNYTTFEFIRPRFGLKINGPGSTASTGGTPTGGS